MKAVGVMQIVDALDPGGLERVAVNIANQLPALGYRSHLCTTRAEGPLADLVQPDVHRLRLERSGRFDLLALRRLAEHIREHEIRILHAHGTALFVATLRRLSAVVVWHDHFGRYATVDRPAWLYRLAARRLAGVIAVNQPLVEWSIDRLGVPANRVWYVPNFVCEPPVDLAVSGLPGAAGARIVCVANLRPEKDHLNLLAALATVARAVPEVHLLLVGQASNLEYLRSVKAAMPGRHVTWLGARSDVLAVLRSCDVGVLSSMTEGFPLALIEYGLSGLPVIATRVGQCAEVLDEGRAGVLVVPRAPAELAAALIDLLRAPQRRAQLGQALRARVRELYSADRVMKQLTAIYRTILTH